MAMYAYKKVSRTLRHFHDSRRASRRSLGVIGYGGQRASKPVMVVLATITASAAVLAAALWPYGSVT